jgi:hypothetical protein
VFLSRATQIDAGCNARVHGPSLNPDDQMLLDMTTLHAGLDLAPDQEPLWQKVDSATGLMLRQNAIDRNTTKEQLRTALNNPTVDLRPLVEQIKMTMTTQDNLTRTALDQWLALDATLTVAQRQTLRKFLHTKVEQSEERDARMNHPERGRGSYCTGDDEGSEERRGSNRFYGTPFNSGNQFRGTMGWGR